MISDVRIYNRVLNITEIQDNYNGNITTGGLISRWKLNDKGDIALDSIGNNNGTIYGANWINQATHKYKKSGTYKVTLTIVNEDGLTDSISKDVTIT